MNNIVNDIVKKNENLMEETKVSKRSKRRDVWGSKSENKNKYKNKNKSKNRNKNSSSNFSKKVKEDVEKLKKELGDL